MIILRRAILAILAVGITASCGDSAPAGEPVGEATDALLAACGAAGTASTELAQASADLCAPHFSRGSANFDERECIFDKNDASGTDSTLDGDIDTCTGTTWDAADISGLALARGTTQRFWAITDAGGKSRTRCGGTCSTGEDVIDPVNGDCVSGQNMIGSKWLFLLGGSSGSAMQIAGQTLLVGGSSSYDMVDPESISRFTSGTTENLVIVDGGLKGNSSDPCNARGVCKAIAAGTGATAHCIVDPAHDGTCSGYTTEGACTGNTSCAWIKEPAEAASRNSKPYAFAILPEPDPDAVATRGAGAYDTVCVQSTNGDANGAAWVYFDFPTTGCGGTGSTYPCPPEATSYASSAGYFNIEASAVLKEKVGASTYNSLVLFSKPPLWKTSNSSCGGGRIYRDVDGDGSGLGATDVRIDHGYTSVFKIENIDQYAIGSVYGSGTPVHAALVAQLDLEKDFANFASQQGQRIADASYAPDPAATDEGWLLFGSQTKLYKRRWKTAKHVLDKAFFTSGSCEATQVAESPSSGACTASVCLPEFESLTSKVSSGQLTTFHAGESAHKVSSGTTQHPAPLAKVVQQDGTKIVFRTSTTLRGGFGGTSGANSWCAGRATAAGLPGTFKAWLSTSTTSAATNVSNHNAYPYVKPNGETVAAGWTGLTSGTLVSPIDQDEFGVTSAAGIYGVWTGTDTAGNATTPNCNNWTTNNLAVAGRVGNEDSAGSDWTNYTNAPPFEAPGTPWDCHYYLSVYCVQN